MCEMSKLSELKTPIALSLSLHAAIAGAVFFSDNENSPSANLQTITTTHQDIESADPATTVPTSEYLVDLNGYIDEKSITPLIDTYRRAASYAYGDDFITVTINSVGGNVDWGNKLIEEINASETPTRILCDKQAASMAAMILITTDNVTSRDATNECEIMIHAPLHSYINGTAQLWITGHDYARIQQEMDNNPNQEEWEFNYTYNTDPNAPMPAPLTISRSAVAANIQDNTALRHQFSQTLAAHSALTEQDYEILFDKGDIYLNAFEALAMGLIDKVEGAEMDEINRIVGEASVCSKHPEISMCQNGPAVPEF